MLIERYTRVVLSQPGAPFPLQRLAQLYRERDGNIAKLVADFETRAAQAGADQYAATVALAGIYKIDGRADDAIKTYEQAIALKPTTRRRCSRSRTSTRTAATLAAARARYEQALAARRRAPADKEQTLRTLMALALDAKDWDGAPRASTGSSWRSSRRASS